MLETICWLIIQWMLVVAVLSKIYLRETALAVIILIAGVVVYKSWRGVRNAGMGKRTCCMARKKKD